MPSACPVRRPAPARCWAAGSCSYSRRLRSPVPPAAPLAVGHIAVGWNAAHAVERRGRGVPRGVGRIHGRIHRWSSPNAASAPVCREDLNETRDRQSEERRLAKRANTERANTERANTERANTDLGTALASIRSMLRAPLAAAVSGAAIASDRWFLASRSAELHCQRGYPRPSSSRRPCALTSAGGIWPQQASLGWCTGGTGLGGSDGQQDVGGQLDERKGPSRRWPAVVVSQG